MNVVCFWGLLKFGYLYITLFQKCICETLKSYIKDIETNFDEELGPI
jgi:hypothetical protein